MQHRIRRIRNPTPVETIARFIVFAGMSVEFSLVEVAIVITDLLDVVCRDRRIWQVLLRIHNLGQSESCRNSLFDYGP